MGIICILPLLFLSLSLNKIEFISRFFTYDIFFKAVQYRISARLILIIKVLLVQLAGFWFIRRCNRAEVIHILNQQVCSTHFSRKWFILTKFDFFLFQFTTRMNMKSFCFFCVFLIGIIICRDVRLGSRIRLFKLILHSRLILRSF